MPAPSVRSATIEDVQTVQLLEERWAEEDIMIGYEPIPPEMVARYVGGCFFVAESDHSVVGFIIGTSRRDDRNAAVVPDGEQYLEIEDVYVLAEHRSSGTGMTLVDAAVAWAREHGIRTITAYSSTRDVERVLRFYRSCGFQSWAVQVYRDLGEEA